MPPRQAGLEYRDALFERRHIAMSLLQAALETIRDRASNTTEQGKAFERPIKVFLENDPTQKQQCSSVRHYAGWTKEHPKYPPRDTCIDLVGKLKDGEALSPFKLTLLFQKHDFCRCAFLIINPNPAHIRRVFRRRKSLSRFIQRGSGI